VFSGTACRGPCLKECSLELCSHSFAAQQLCHSIEQQSIACAVYICHSIYGHVKAFGGPSPGPALLAHLVGALAEEAAAAQADAAAEALTGADWGAGRVVVGAA